MKMDVFDARMSRPSKSQRTKISSESLHAPGAINRIADRSEGRAGLVETALEVESESTVTTHGMTHDRAIRGNQGTTHGRYDGRKLLSDVIVHVVVLVEGFNGGIEIKAGTLTEILWKSEDMIVSE